ncbi:MAG TPA: hypothetical protein VF540_03040, partial [Segetibacter sp.]
KKISCERVKKWPAIKDFRVFSTFIQQLIPYFCCLNLKLYINMSVIQRIRDKYAALVIGVIALSLIGFILMEV